MGKIGRARFVALWLVLVACAGQVAAQGYVTTGPIVLQQAGSQVTSTAGAALPKSSALNDLLVGRTYTPKVAGAVDLKDLLKTPYIPKPNVPVSAVRAVPWSAIAKGVGRAVPFVGTALTIKDLLDAVRCREKFGGGSECDDGEPETPTQTWCAASPGAPGGQVCASSRVAVCQGMLQYVFVPSGGTKYCAGIESSPPYIVTCLTSGCADPSYGTPNYQGPTIVMSCIKGGVKGPDGMCPTGDYDPKTDEQVGTKVETHGDKAKAAAAAADLDKAGVPLPHPQPSFIVPPLVTGDRTTTTLPDNSVKVRDVEYPMEATPDGYKWRERVTETEYPPGATIPPQGQTPTQPGTVQEGPPTVVEFKSCGLPGMPPCKIDETGTPAGQGVETAPGEQVDAIKVQGVELVTAAQAPALPWMFALELPAGACSPLTWTIRGHTMVIDFCSNWLVGFWRELLAWAVYAMSGLYIWRSVASATGGT